MHRFNQRVHIFDPAFFHNFNLEDFTFSTTTTFVAIEVTNKQKLCKRMIEKESSNAQQKLHLLALKK